MVTHPRVPSCRVSSVPDDCSVFGTFPKRVSNAAEESTCSLLISVDFGEYSSCDTMNVASDANGPGNSVGGNLFCYESVLRKMRDSSFLVQIMAETLTCGCGVTGRAEYSVLQTNQLSNLDKGVLL